MNCPKNCLKLSPKPVSKTNSTICRPTGRDGPNPLNTQGDWHRLNRVRTSIASAFQRGYRAILASADGSLNAPTAKASARVLLLTLMAFQPAQAQQSPTPTETRQARPDEPGSAVTDAVKLMNQGRHAEAINKLETALKGTPRDPRLRFTYGLVLADQGKPNEAIDVLTQLTQDYPELPEPFNNLAVLHAARGDLEKARFALENALRALPNYSLGHENLGDLYLRLAARSYEQANANDRANTAAQSKLVLTRELLTRVAPTNPAKNPAPAEPLNAPASRQ